MGDDLREEGGRAEYFQDFAPSVPFHSLFLSFPSLPGSSVTQLLARDLDNDPLVFGVVGEEASRFFAVESVTGVVWLRQPLDREVMLLSAEGRGGKTSLLA